MGIASTTKVQLEGIAAVLTIQYARADCNRSMSMLVFQSLDCTRCVIIPANCVFVFCKIDCFNCCILFLGWFAGYLCAHSKMQFLCYFVA